MNAPKKLLLSKRLMSATAGSLFFLALCFGLQFQPSAVNAQDTTTSTLSGELVYVPIYSSIFYENGKHTIELAATLSIHNINPDGQVTIVRADYYNSDGKLIKKYLPKPLVLQGLQTKNLVIEKEDKTGGTGANFIVEWSAVAGSPSPLIEAVMVNASSNLGIAFTTSGKVIRRTGAAAK